MSAIGVGDTVRFATSPEGFSFKVQRFVRARAAGTLANLTSGRGPIALLTREDRVGPFIALVSDLERVESA